MKDADPTHGTGRSLAVRLNGQRAHVVVGMDAGNYCGAEAGTCRSLRRW